MAVPAQAYAYYLQQQFDNNAAVVSVDAIGNITVQVGSGDGIIISAAYVQSVSPANLAQLVLSIFNGTMIPPPGITSFFIPPPIPPPPITATTWDPANKTSNIILTGGNLIATRGVSGAVDETVRSIGLRTGGQAHVEFQILTSGNAGQFIGMGIYSEGLPLGGSIYVGQNEGGIALWPAIASRSGVGVYFNAVQIATLPPSLAINPGDIYAMEVNLDVGKFWWMNVTEVSGWNGDVIANQNPATNIGGIVVSLIGAPWAIALDLEFNGDSVQLNAGQSPYAQSPSTGYGNW